MPNASQVAYCGLFCGDCIIRRGKIGRRSADLLRLMRTAEFRRLSSGLPVIDPNPFKALAKADDCCAVLGAMSHLDCQRACKQGGGSAECKIKRCCKEKKIAGCWKCESLEDCETLAWLKPVNGDAHLMNPHHPRQRHERLPCRKEELVTEGRVSPRPVTVHSRHSRLSLLGCEKMEHLFSMAATGRIDSRACNTICCGCWQYSVHFFTT